MFAKLDEKFQAVLDDNTKLEAHLLKLDNQRYWSTMVATALASYIFAHAMFVLFVYRSSISVESPLGLNVPPGMVLMPLLFLILVLQWTVKAVVAHGEIRTLLAFKKLLALRAND